MSCWWSAIDRQEAEGFDAICSGEPSGTTAGFQPRVRQDRPQEAGSDRLADMQGDGDAATSLRVLERSRTLK